MNTNILKENTYVNDYFLREYPLHNTHLVLA